MHDDTGLPAHDPLRPHSHEPNPEPPTAVPDVTLELPNGRVLTLDLPTLHNLPAVTVENCIIVSTGHGASGPFAFRGVSLLALVQAYWSGAWRQVAVHSADGFGNRVLRAELEQPDPAGPILLAYACDGVPLTRPQGLVRLIVPSERDDALRQVKWVARVVVL
ncbi:MAG: molybdopterin-dependent oxidoreductase [Caldilineaceae bacterium]|nr:molybdopterin-dependent oxidoreductase [Caldilineaceae bacterium]